MCYITDVKGCCIRNGMTHRSCMEKMCDPKKVDLAQIPDLMVCAPWANTTFFCLANPYPAQNKNNSEKANVKITASVKLDHTSCCRSRGIPEGCMSFCSGNVSTLTFMLFRYVNSIEERDCLRCALFFAK